MYINEASNSWTIEFFEQTCKADVFWLKLQSDLCSCHKVILNSVLSVQSHGLSLNVGHSLPNSIKDCSLKSKAIQIGLLSQSSRVAEKKLNKQIVFAAEI